MTLEEHSVTTDDGYVLKMFRVTHDSFANKTKAPVLFMHGVDDSADCWIINEAESAPAFVAARSGYDVWLGNWRGNKYSRKHLTLDPNQNAKEFFDFSWTDMSKHDFPAFI
jgi:lysosomal acid lipase/cholesteryl ester hydrolase